LIHSDKDSNFETATELKLSREATREFNYCCYEVEVTLEVHENGESFILAVGDTFLTRKVKAS